jgi:alpha-tubulin suppressor-like RCC1 family protein
MDDGTVRCWGSNGSGQLGDGSKTNALAPESIGPFPLAQFDLGGLFTCEAVLAGGAECWGSNVWGQLGDGTTTEHDSPEVVTALGLDTTQIATGFQHACALMGDSTVRCWGNNAYGQLGDGTSGTSGAKYSPVPITALGTNVQHLALGDDHSCALLKDGSVDCWGANAAGEVGDGSTTDQHLPKAITALGTGIIQVAAGSDATCAVFAVGSLYCWGLNSSGQMGDGTTTDVHSPTEVTLPGNATQVTVGGSHVCAIVSDDFGGELGVYCWGGNFDGQLGDGTTTDRHTPTLVSALGTNVAMVAAGGNHTCALMKDSSVRCWGDNTFGQVGTGAGTTTTPVTTPTSPKW